MNPNDNQNDAAQAGSQPDPVQSEPVADDGSQNPMGGDMGGQQAPAAPVMGGEDAPAAVEKCHCADQASCQCPKVEEPAESETPAEETPAA